MAFPKIDPSRVWVTRPDRFYLFSFTIPEKIWRGLHFWERWVLELTSVVFPNLVDLVVLKEMEEPK